MSTIEITRVEDVREGDVVTMRDTLGGEYVGRARASVPGARQLYFGPHGNGWPVMYRNNGWTFVRATREVPDLPTEPGSVIVNATIRGIEGVTAFLAGDGDWVSSPIGPYGSYWHTPKHITAWRPAKIVPEETA